MEVHDNITEFVVEEINNIIEQDQYLDPKVKIFSNGLDYISLYIVIYNSNIYKIKKGFNTLDEVITHLFKYHILQGE